MRDDQGYADLLDYALLGDGRTAALVGADGRIDWLPLPALDSPAAFAALLDAEHGGHLSLAPVGEHTTTRHYEPGTCVLVTVHRTADGGEVRITDSLNTGVAGALPWSELARRIDGVTGSVRLRAVAEPGTCLNTASPYVEQAAASACLLRVDHLSMAVQCAGEQDVTWTDRSVTVEFETSPGSRHLFAVVATEGEPLYVPPAEVIDAGVDRTIGNWQHWSDTFGWDGRWPEHVLRSAIVLKQLVQRSSGAMAAAVTVALPETLDGGKNWDYRFAWTRDTAYSLTALLRFGLREEVHSAISWLLRALRDCSEPQVMYRLDGSQPDGTVERDVPGWRGVGPVVEGNRAAGQLQLGVYGDIFSIVRLYVDDGNVLDTATARSLSELADTVCDRWRSVDSGMWELPEARHHTTSKLGCWQALTHAVHLESVGQLNGPAPRWRAEAQRIREWVEQNCWDDAQQAWTWYPGTSDLDASILLHAISGFDRGPRMLSTIRALQRELGDGPLLYRFTGAAEEEGAFTACAFWVVSALYLCGEEDEAVTLMDELLERLPNDVGLLAEMTGTDAAFLGNLPQALSHLALVNAAITASGR